MITNEMKKATVLNEYFFNNFNHADTYLSSRTQSVVLDGA